jgi:Flp pilus assembly protein TadB
MRAEDLRMVALVLLACAAVAIAGDVLLAIMGTPLVWLVVVVAAALFCLSFALLLIAQARRLERRLLSRIENL